MRNASLSLLLLLPLSGSTSEKDLAEIFKVVEKHEWKIDPGMEIRARIKEANRKDVEKWKGITSPELWEKERSRVLAALRKRVLPTFEPQEKVRHLVTGKIPAEGFVIENIVYETIPGLVVTANLYRPEPMPKHPPAILLVHSHHNPKTQGELQDMGMLWARAGCLVLVPDLLGHGERRQHSFIDAGSYPEPFKVSRQDYYFRYNLGVQLAMAGESLIGWMARDMMRGVDLVLERGADPRRIILMGAVAGGGDPAGVTAALDERIACVVPFNFGGPQPETKFPLPADAETSFSYHSGGYWESTRNLPFSISDDFPHWAIVASVAPRKLIHAHEFSWDQERDPVWKRFQKIWGWHKATDGLGFAHGTGLLSGKAPEASHCNNIGAVHRKMIYPYLKRWFDIPVPTEEYSKRVPAEKLLCMSKEALESFKPMSVVQILRKKVADNPTLIGDKGWREMSAKGHRKDFSTRTEDAKTGQVQWTRITFHHEDKAVPVWAEAIHLKSGGKGKTPPRAVIAVAQQGVKGFVTHRAKTIDLLLSQGIDVVIVEVRGLGKFATAGGRGRTGSSTSLSATEWMLGGNVLEDQANDFWAVLRHLKAQKAWAGGRMALWGDNFARINDASATIAVPHDAGKQLAHAEPAGPLLALMVASVAEDFQGVYVHGGLSRFASLLDSSYFYLPHDALVPNILPGKDIPQLASFTASKCDLKVEGLVNARNQKADKADLEAYSPLHRSRHVELRQEVSTQEQIAEWLANRLLK